jgi:hypothetical protein
LWGAGSLTELGIPTREWSIKLNQNSIRELAVGFTEARKLNVRPKSDCVAVMFFANDRYFWTHLTNKEFLICYPELEEIIEN